MTLAKSNEIDQEHDMRVFQLPVSAGITTATKLPGLLGLDRDNAEQLRQRFVPLDEGTLLDLATKKTGLNDFGDDRIYSNLGLLLESYEKDACLNFIGRIAAQQDTLRLLKTRLWLEEDRKRFPKITQQSIRKPIFITGLPRSGTTLLHNLLAQDPANRVPMSWEVMFPSPPPARATFETDPRIAKAETAFRWLDGLAPDFRAIHPFGARNAQECIEITSYAFESPRFHTTHNAVSYQTWLTDHKQIAAYAYHRRMLQHLQSCCPAQRWVLKAPAHLFALDAIFETYDDACVIHTHRDPLEVLPSTASLTMVLRSAFSNKVDPNEIGIEVTERWAEGLRRAMAFRDADAKRDRFFDVWYREFIADPIATVRTIYRHFDLEWTSRIEARMRRFLAANPQNKSGTHTYTLAQFGLTPEAVGDQFRTYYDRFHGAPAHE